MTKRSKQKFTSIMLRPSPEESRLLENAIKLTGEAAATKAVFRVLADYERIKKEFNAIGTRLQNTQHQLDTYKDAANDLRNGLRFLTANKT